MGSSCNNRDLRRGIDENKATKIDIQLVYGQWLKYTVRTKIELRKGIFVGEYKGRVCNEISEHSQYVIKLSGGKETCYICGKKEGNICIFIYHSCYPNLVVKQMSVDGRVRVGFYAKRYIPPNYILTYDYRIYGRDLWFTCECGAKDCVSNKKRASKIRKT